jgi:hypothetical protein
MMTPAEFSEIQQRAEKATTGPWKKYRVDKEDLKCSITGKLFEYEAKVIEADYLLSDDAEFIAHARQDIPSLLAHISEQEDKIGRLANENQRLRVALQDAIRKPMGVIPDSAVPFTL